MDVVCVACSKKQECTKVGPLFKCGHTMCFTAALHCGHCIQCGEKVWTDPRPFSLPVSKPESKPEPKPKTEPRSKTMADYVDIRLQTCSLMLDEFEKTEEALEPTAKEMISLFRENIANGTLNLGMLAWMNDVDEQKATKRSSAAAEEPEPKFVR